MGFLLQSFIFITQNLLIFLLITYAVKSIVPAKKSSAITNCKIIQITRTLFFEIYTGTNKISVFIGSRTDFLTHAAYIVLLQEISPNYFTPEQYRSAIS
jgi:hypothetical protein